MPTLAAASSLAASPGRPPWWVMAALTAAVVLAHVLLLGLVPAAIGSDPSPLADKFITRTIVIAPPAPSVAEPAPPAPAKAAAPAARPRPPAPARPAHPRAVHPQPLPAAEAPVPEPAPPPETPIQDEPQTPDLTAQAAAPDTATDPAAAAAPAAAASSPAGTGDAGTGGTATAPGGTSSDGAGAAADAGATSGNIAGPQALRIPGSVLLHFAVTAQQGASPMSGVFGELRWLQDGGNYDARLSLKFLFSTVRSQHSTGRIGPSGIEPTRFSDTRKTEVASHFVRDQGQVVFSNNAPSVPLLPGAQDRLSVVMQLGGLLAGDPARYPAGSRISMQTVGPRDAEVWVFNVDGEEQMSVPAGDYAVRKLTRSPRRDFDDKIELWMAPALGYLPVRIKQTQPNGDFVDMQLREKN